MKSCEMAKPVHKTLHMLPLASPKTPLIGPITPIAGLQTPLADPQTLQLVLRPLQLAFRMLLLGGVEGTDAVHAINLLPSACKTKELAS